jgi:hypothetical protein
LTGTSSKRSALDLADGPTEALSLVRRLAVDPEELPRSS